MTGSDPREKSQLKILHLEDDGVDAALIREILEQEGVNCDITVVSSREPFQRAIERSDIDLVLSDYKLPDIRGDEALMLIRQKWPDLPFIFVSGSIGEERATEVVRQGATDYVMKERLRRLGLAIHRAIEEAEERQKRRKVEVSLEQERELLGDLFSSVQDGIVVLDQELKVVRCNPTAEKFFGHIMPLQGRSCCDLIVCHGKDDLACLAGKTLESGMAQQGVKKCVTAKGEADFNIFAFPLVDRHTGDRKGVILYLRDVTRELLLNRQLIQAQKMECIGQLAGSVAHDFNNILQSIMMTSELLAASLDGNDYWRSEVEEIRKTAERAVTLTRQLTTFSRKDVIAPTTTDLNRLVQNMGTMLNRLLKGGLVIKFNLAPRIAQIKCDPGRIEQVIMNFVVNARDAMGDSGEIEIATRSCELTEEEAALEGPDARPGTYVCLSVKDTGAGIPPENMPRLFEPFFTTKSAANGTGLGLPTVYGIVKQHHGWIDVQSTVGQGTTFTVFLPVDNE